MSNVVVGTLSVDLVARTAAFQGDLGKAAQSARGSFSDIKNSARDASRGMDLHEAKGSLALLSEQVGVTIPRHLRSFIVMMPGVGQALNTAFSSVAVIALIGIVVEAGRKVSELAKAAEESRKKWGELHESFDTLKVKGEDSLVSLKARFIELTDGPVAALEYRIQHISEEFESLQFGQQIKSQMDALQAAAKGSTPFYFIGTEGTAEKEAKEFYGKFYEALRSEAGRKSAADILAKEIQRADEQAAKAIHTQPTAVTDGWKQYAAALRDVNTVLQQNIEASELQKKTLEQEKLRATADAAKKAAEQWKKLSEAILAAANASTLYQSRGRAADYAKLAPNAESADPTGQLRELNDIGKITDQARPNEKPLYSGSQEAMTLEKIKTDASVAIDETNKIRESIKTVNEKYQEQLAIITELHNQGRLTDDEYNRALKNIKQQLDKNNVSWKDFAQNSMKTVEAAMMFGSSWRDALKSIIVQLAEVILKMTVLKKLNESMDEGGGGGGGGGFSLGSLFGGFSGFFASGGTVPAGSWGIAGENGPEPVFGGTSAVTVFPASHGASQSVSVVYQIDARGADPTLITRLPLALKQVEDRAVRRAVATVSDRSRRSA